MALALFTFPAQATATEDTPESAGARYADELRQSLAPLMRTYGPDAVNLEGNLLRYAIDHGALLEASVGTSGTVTHAGSSYLVINLETGLVFRDSEVAAASRPARVWTDVIEPSLRKCRRLQLPTEGIEIRASYRHSEFADRADLAHRFHAGTLQVEALTFRLKTTDIVQLAEERMSPQDFLVRTTIEVNGQAIDLQLPVERPPED